MHGYEQYLRSVLQMNLGARAIEQAWLRCVFNVAAVNCDDHTKNLAFLMDETGQWKLAPAFDVCFAHNPGAGKWITGEDLLELGAAFGVNRPKVLLERVSDAIGRWPAFAREAGVPRAIVKHIASLQPQLVVRPRVTVPVVKTSKPRKKSTKKARH